MCGIVAYLGEKSAQPILIEGLKRLEYRGYDSAGIALLDRGSIRVRKAPGRISVLERQLDDAAAIDGVTAAVGAAVAEAVAVNGNGHSHGNGHANGGTTEYPA